MHVDRSAGKVLANQQAVMKIAVALAGLLALMLTGWSGGDVHGAPPSPPNIRSSPRDLAGGPERGYFVAKTRKYW